MYSYYLAAIIPVMLSSYSRVIFGDSLCPPPSTFFLLLTLGNYLPIIMTFFRKGEMLLPDVHFGSIHSPFQSEGTI
jgi:hypothetical protein